MTLRSGSLTHSYRFIPLRRRRGPDLQVIVDAADFHAVSCFNWHAVPSGHTIYAARHLVRNGRKTTQGMHSFLLGAQLVDHIDGDGLNNRRVNLRAASKAENARNRKPNIVGASPYKGVTWHKQRGMWRARIKVDGRDRHLGCFTTEIEAARAYDAAALETFGAFARPNLGGGE